MELELEVSESQDYSEFPPCDFDEVRLLNGPVIVPFKAGTVQYLKAVDRETPTSEHRLFVSSPELHSRRQPVVVST